MELISTVFDAPGQAFVAQVRHHLLRDDVGIIVLVRRSVISLTAKCVIILFRQNKCAV